MNIDMNGMKLTIILNDDIYEVYSEELLLGTITAPQEGLDFLKELLLIVNK